MGFSLCSLFCILVLALFFKFKPLASQDDPGVETSQSQLNTDMFFVSEFFKKMGLTLGRSRTPVCSWQGVFCDAQNHHVYGLVASGLGLSGAIPDVTIGKLSKLQSLDLSNNKITALPSDLWSLGSLKSLNLSKNIISGSLPNNIGNFGELESLDLSGNNFSGEVPRALSSLLNLKVLKLNQNGFQWSIPREILSCQSLVSIDLSSNRLNGSLPAGFGAAFPKLKALILARNEISQVQLSSSTSHLVYLDLSENRLSGEVVHGLNEAPSLKHLNLAHNRVSRHEFPQTDKLLVLEYLNLSKTGLIGHIPNQISKLTHLKTLDLSQNYLSGHVPFMNMKSLIVLDLSHNNLSGHIPTSLLEKLPSMKRFDFSYNNLTFCVPEFSQGTLKKAFFGSSSSCPVAANPSQFKRRDSKNKAMKLALALTLSVTILLLALLFLTFGCKRKTKMWAVKHSSSIKSYREEQNNLGPFSFQTDSTTWVADVKVATSVEVVIFEKPLLNLTFADLLSATSSFDRGTLLAEGRFGPVYRGFLPGNIHVAVKVLVHGSTLTDQEAAAELESLGRIKHPNLLPLMGYCLAGEKMIAIYEYMENGNLRNFLHDLPLGVLQTTEDWSTETWEESDNNGIQNVGSESGSLTSWRFRHKIALGTARALAFLHHGCSPPIIHRDVRASSVYLDYNLEPRLSDFGLAKVVGRGSEDTCHGSPGYMPPELFNEMEPPTPKTDVYCFGVVLFELITGKKAIGDGYGNERETSTSLVSWVRGLVRKNQKSRAVDPKIVETGLGYQMEEAIKIGYLCTAELPSKRPSMQQVVGLLKDIEPAPKRTEEFI